MPIKTHSDGRTIAPKRREVPLILPTGISSYVLPFVLLVGSRIEHGQAAEIRYHRGRRAVPPPRGGKSAA